jgi:hypothetical protein
VDVVFDTVAAVIRSSGHAASLGQVGAMITIAADSEGTADQRVKDAVPTISINDLVGLFCPGAKS